MLYLEVITNDSVSTPLNNPGIDTNGSGNLDMNDIKALIKKSYFNPEMINELYSFFL